MDAPDGTQAPAVTPTRRKSGVVLAAVVGVVLVGAAIGVYRVAFSGVPFIDEWHCPKGEAPATYQDGGSNCFPDGSTLPDGVTWDPLGNRPFSCDGRRGWTVIHRGQESDCLRDGRNLPDGWSK